MSLYYLINQFGGQYVLGFVIVAMTLRVVNAISDSDFKFWQMSLLDCAVARCSAYRLRCRAGREESALSLGTL